ncbi:tetratricopeptide repeat protein [Azospirillum sp. YIM B02556]|uniref:Tetratricopeptide repeat protein n=1 Tax=Azospirillum endophyticum TaxID=2800326 RepID=A0ABS1FBC3_9PROT|nr:class I SAM-dependent methyltransferase [Azospirillum endophyticum]MBK1840716.1 tetratricopeptide repeat protein [Azospirillum endophyticum]
MTAADTTAGTASLPREQSTPDDRAVEQRLSQILELCRTGRPEEAEGPYREMLGTPPRDAAGLLSLAEAARILGRPVETVAWAEAAVRLQPDRAEGWSVLAFAFIAAGRPDDGYAAAAETLRRAGAAGGTAAIQAHRAQALARLRRGQLAEAAAACEEALRLAGTVAQPAQGLRQAQAETLGTLALVRTLEGRAEEAEALFQRALSHRPLLPEILGNHASLLARLGRDEEALEQAEQAVALRPRLAGTLHLIGTLHHRAGQPESAIAAFHRVLAVDPGHLDARLRLADSLRVAGHWEEAAVVCHDGLARIANPDDPGRTALLANLGAALQTGGDAAGALEAYREALRLAPDLPEVHNNLARLHQETGNPDAAIEALRHATNGRTADMPLPLRRALLSLLIAAGRTAEAEAEAFGIARTAPEDAELCFGIAALFLQGGRRDQALPYVRKAIRLAPDVPRNWIALVEALRDATLPEQADGADEGLRADLLTALGRPEVEGAGLSRAIAGVLMASPILRHLAALPEDEGPALDEASRTLLADGSLAGLAEDALLLAHLRAAPVCDPALERAVTRLRRVLLLALTGPGLPDRPAWRALCAAIAEQCFLNEYVFAETDGEFQVLAVLVRTAEAALDRNEQPPAVLVALLGAYRPLYHWERATALQALSWPEEIAQLLDRQVTEPLNEAAIQAELPALTPIDNPVSVGVRAQYEENPYPRWMSTGLLPEPVPLPRFLHALFPYATLPASPAWDAPGWEAPEVLVAGCGTGREAVWAASTLKNAKVLAVDLSRRSLAYATRQSRRMGLTGIEFAQADLLELGALGRRFDVVHSVGVLHHMEDPMAGLRVLRRLMRPHGVMEVGFYSAAARRPILAARQFIAERGHPPTLEGIRHVRRDILALPEGHPARAVVRSPDFYGTSACRDLLMHVHELHVTLPWLAGALDTLGLEFLGFRLADPAVAALYRKRFPEDPAMTSLPRWDRLEAEHPMIFGGLYQTWVRVRE